MWGNLEEWRGQIEGRTIVSSVIASLIVMLFAAIGNLPLWAIAITGLAGFSILPWGLIGWRKLSQLRYRSADFKKWDRVGLPALWQAACLYDDIEPYGQIRDGTPCYASLQMLKSEIMAGNLEVVGEYGKGGDNWQRVRRDDLKKIAERHGDRPKSLFPEDR